MAHPIRAGVFLVLTLSAWSPATADADGVKVFIGGAKGHYFRAPRDSHAVVVFDERRLRPGVHRFPSHGHPHPLWLAVPRPVVIVSSPPPCAWIPGYWANQWIPQSYTGTVWVPGHWSPDGTWIEGHYEGRTVSTGYYQPVWIAGRCIQ